MASKIPHRAAAIHHAYLEALRSQTGPTQILAGILARKLGAQGIDVSKHAGSIERWAAQILASESKSDEASFVLDLDDGDSTTREISVHLSPSDIEQAGQAITDAIEATSEDLFESLSKDTLQSVLKDPSARLLDLTNERDAFVRRLGLTWAKPLNLLDIHVAVCHEIGAARNDWLRKVRRRSKDHIVVEVLTRLHGRASQVAAEVQALLRNGFADGALSRWRTMHELTVTAMFVAEHGAVVAERYVAHLDADSIKAARQYQRFAPSLGHRPISARQQQRLDAAAITLERKYGKQFLGDYGWAADALKNPSPTFASIEAAVDLNRLRPYFRLASNTVHAGAKGTFFRLGLVDGQNAILAGASNVGLEEPGRLVALSLSQITTVLLMFHANIDSIVWSRVLLNISLKVEKHFVRVQRRIEREEREVRRIEGR